jgi:hypothetical protein
MKKILLTIAFALLPCIVFAQGRVNFSNPNTAFVSTNFTSVGGTAGAADFALTQLRVGLYIAPAGTSDLNAFTLASLDVAGTPALATNRAAAFRGLFNGGNPFPIQGNAGTQIAFQIRAWSFPYLTYEAAAADWNNGVAGVLIGSSTIGSVTPATGAATTPALFGAGAGQVGGFAVIPNVPEPSTIALGLLGLGAVALFRRRK